MSPSLKIHVDSVYTLTPALEPHLHFNATWNAASEQVCANLWYDVDLSLESELHVDIEWAHIQFDLDDVCGPKNLYNNTAEIGEKCVCVGVSECGGVQRAMTV